MAEEANSGHNSGMMRPSALIRAVNILALLAALPAGAFAQAAARPAPPAAPQVSASAPQASVSKASVVGYEGRLVLQKAGQAQRVTINALPTALEPGDKLFTYRKGSAMLQFRDGSRVTLGEFAIFTVEEEKPEAVTLNLALGKIWCAVAKLKGRRFSVKTPTAVAAVRGTEFTIDVREARTSVEVFGGLVGVRGSLGAESMVGASQRVDVSEGRMGRVERFEAKPEARMPQAAPAPQGAQAPGGPGGPDGEGDDTGRKGPQDQQAQGEQGPDGRRGPPPEGQEQRGPKGPPLDENGKPLFAYGPAEHRGVFRPVEQQQGDAVQFGFNPERFKEFVELQARETMNRDMLESAAAFEQKNQLYQEGKTLIDAFGRRVRVEEYITRPSADSFKFVSLNFRDNRFDTASVEVTANRNLPERLADAGNLWFSPGTTMPAFYAVKQRLSMSNGVDNLVELGVDGVPQLFSISGGKIFDPNTNTFVDAPASQFYRTMFGSRYEFLNGNQAAIDDIYNLSSFRPATNNVSSANGNATSGMMWRTQPVKVNITDGLGGPSRGEYWTDAFVTYTGQQGMAYAKTSFQPTAGASHFVTERSYFNFVDSNSNGILDFGDASDPGGGGYFHDIVGRANANGTLNTTGFVANTQNGGDNQVYINRDGANAPGANPQQAISYTGGYQGAMMGVRDFARAQRDYFSVADEFAIDDFGQVLPAGGSSGGANFTGANFERRVRSNLFKGDIDVVMSPGFVFQAGMANAGSGDKPINSPGPK